MSLGDSHTPTIPHPPASIRPPAPAGARPGARPVPKARGQLAAHAKHVLRAQPRLFLTLFTVPPLVATAFWAKTGSPEGFRLAGVIVAGVALYVAAHALLKTMTAQHWGIMAGGVVGALMLNGGVFGIPMLISFGSLLAVVLLVLREPRKRIVKIVLVASLVWFGTAGASTMNAAHDQVQAGLTDASPQVLTWARDRLGDLFGLD